jgi:hypothetical protein
MLELLIILGVGLALLVIITRGRNRTGLNRAHFQQKWDEINMLKNSSQAGLKLAVIEADKLLDKALKQLSYGGDTMADRMKQAGAALGDQNAVWTAHKFRNRLVHEDVQVRKSHINKSLNAFRRALKSLGAL